LGYNFNGKVGTSQFAQLAGNAILRPGGKDFIFPIQFKDVFGAKVNADATPLAPVSVDGMLFQLWFWHTKSSNIDKCDDIEPG
jgi:hypothetical protein